MKKVLLILFCCISILKTHAATVYASTYGYTTTDATAALQAAINSGNTPIIVDVQAADWNIGPIKIDGKNPITIIFKPGVVVRALPGMFPNNTDCLFEIKNSQNVVITAYGASFIMNKSEYTSGEKRHAFAVQNSKKVTITGALLQDAGGDGIYIGADYNLSIKCSETITVTDVVTQNCLREGITITDAKAVKIQHCEFNNSNGATYASGIKLQPVTADDSLVNIGITRCRMINNQNHAIEVDLQNLTNTSRPVSVTFFRCYSVGNGAEQVKVLGRESNGVNGNVTLNMCLIDSSNAGGLYIRKNHNEFALNLTECVFRNVAKSAQSNVYPMVSEVTSYTNNVGRHGGVNFNNVLLTYNGNKPWFKSLDNAGTSPGLGSLSGFTVVWNPQQNSAPDFGANPSNITVNDSLLAVWPTITVITFSNDNVAGEGNTNRANFKIERTHSNNLYFPMCATYSISGTAINGQDCNRLVGCQIMPTGEPYLKDSLYAMADGITEPNETVIYTLDPSWMYVIGAVPSSTLNIKANSKRDEGAIFETQESNVFYNNITQQLMFKNNDVIWHKLELFNMAGQQMLSNGFASTISLQDFNPGVYVVVLSDANQQIIERTKILKQ
ncbi:MAG: T9SS type A sorting domain-containing protein [Bacteroidia bacterium]|nr:T9SS type A sorting domain-containing protein [Bacteroidia bacterium]HQU99619.1 T9SS type A sorting domain-containing protein [Bacteroidia bacterium]